MRSIIVTALLALIVTARLSAQDAAELDRRNGFKTIVLATTIDSVKGAVFKKDFKEKEIFEAKLYETRHPDYMSIGEVKVRQVELKTYKNLVYRIIVITDKDPRIMQSLSKSYGKATYDMGTGRYTWAGTSVSLSVLSSKKTYTLTYSSYPIYKMMNDDKGKKVDVMAEDF